MSNRTSAFVLVATLFASLVSAQAQTPRPLARLDTNGRDLLLSAMGWGDRYWDDQLALLRSFDRGRMPRHLVRETSWYALGLLQRGSPGDAERAIRALRAVLGKQFHEPGERWDGTFLRSPEEPHPAPSAEMWTNYDPNWREFIGTTFAIILLDYRKQLPAELIRNLEDSIRHAIEGEIREKRLSPRYTNISLMYGFLWSYAARQLGRSEWRQPSEEWISTVLNQFKEHNSFDEFNSPTYYGVDLYGLALWRVHGVTPEIRQKGSEMEAALWRSIASFYHAGLKNIAGPYDRSYGMDMRKYVSVTGLWLRLVLGVELAPFPPLEKPLEHGNDLIFAPLAVSLGAMIPADAMSVFRNFPGEHLVTQELPGNRVATAWLGQNVMLGGEFTGLTRDAGSPRSQFHPATVHWRMPNGDVGWIRLIECPRVDVRAEKDKLSITSVAGNLRFRVHAPSANKEHLKRDRWQLPGLNVTLQTDANTSESSPVEDDLDVIYRNATNIALQIAR